MSGLHSAIRRVTRAYPFRTPANFVNAVLGRLFFDDAEARWLVAEPYSGHPAMVLNVATPFQRKIFYFPRAYARYWYGLPFASYLRARLRPGDVFLDVGANVGYYTLAAAGIVGPAGRVVAFEPDPVTFEALSRTVELNELANVTCVNQALSDRDGTAEFFRTDGTAHSLVPGTAAHRRLDGTAVVRVGSLDGWMRDQGDAAPAEVALVKIDVEGEEPRTVAGLVATLPRVGFPDLWIEVRGPHGSKRAPGTFAPVHERLTALGYRSFRYGRDGKATEVSVADVDGQEDILFVTRASP